MQTIITPTAQLDVDTQQNIMSVAPEERQGIKQELTNALTQDARVQFAQQNISAYTRDDDGKIVSYCAFGNKGNYYHNFIPNILHNFYRPAILIYLFTREDVQNQGHAKDLFSAVAQYASAQGHDGILLSTTHPRLQTMYQRRGANPYRMIQPGAPFFVKENITQDSIFGFQLAPQ